MPLAPLSEQQRIVAAIDEQFSHIDAAVMALKRAILAADHLTLSLVDATIGKGVGVASTADLNAVPSSSRWPRVALRDIARIDSGPAFRSAMFRGPGQGVPLLRGENIAPGTLRWADTRTWPEDALAGHEHLLVDTTDLILGMDRPVVSAGLKLAQVRPSDLPALLVQRVARIRPGEDVTTPYLAVALRSRRFVIHLLASQTGTQLPHITLEAIRSYRLSLPPLAEQQRIAEAFQERVAAIDATREGAVAAAKRGARLRSSILAAAFLGKLVPQDPSDEPASILLRRIAGERASSNGNRPSHLGKARTTQTTAPA